MQEILDPSRLPLKTLAVSPSGRYLAFGGDDLLVKVADFATNEVVAIGVGHSKGVVSVQWTPDEKQLVSAGEDASICVWNFFDI